MKTISRIVKLWNSEAMSDIVCSHLEESLDNHLRAAEDDKELIQALKRVIAYYSRAGG